MCYGYEVEDEVVEVLGDLQQYSSIFRVFDLREEERELVNLFVMMCTVMNGSF
jgi:hypothetical protein